MVVLVDSFTMLVRIVSFDNTIASRTCNKVMSIVQALNLDKKGEALLSCYKSVSGVIRYFINLVLISH